MTSHICLACRRRLAALRPPRLLQWQSRATFISLSSKPKTTPSDKATDELLELGRGNENRKNPLPSNSSRGPRSVQGKRPADSLEILFEKSLYPAPDEPSQPFTSLEPYKHAEVLKKMLAGSPPLADSWHYFVEHFGPNATKPGFIKETSYLNSIARELSERIVQAKKLYPLSKTLPSVADVSRVYLQLGILQGPEWKGMMRALLECILGLGQSPPADIEACLIEDLLGAWNVVCRVIGDPQHLPQLDSESLDWSHIPHISSGDVKKIYQKRGLQVLFGTLTPQIGVRHLEGVPMIAIATFIVLTADSIPAQSIAGTAPSFIALLTQIVSLRGIALNDVYGKDYSPPVIAEFVKENWTSMRQLAAQMSPQEAPGRRATVDPTIHYPETGDVIQTSWINQRLDDAKKRQSVRDVDNLWTDVAQWPVKQTSAPQPVTLKRGILTRELCNYFILTYFSLRQMNRAIGVWNHMVQSGLEPTLQTWDAMLSGCKAARDWKTLEGMWSKMHASGVQPDIFCWTTRLTGIMESGQLDLGIRALDEMGRLWLAAARKAHPKMSLEQLQLVPEVAGAVKPTIATINGVVVGLVRKQRPEAARRILTWASNFGISPDIITYNTLLRPLIRNGLTKEATKLLQQMEKAGVPADVATFTTILDETFRYSEHHTPEEQKEIVDEIFSQMEKAGVEANLHTYGKIIYELLQTPNGMSTVNFVMERMANQGIQPGSVIYTSLISYHFEQTPPNLDAIRGIVERAKMVVGSSDYIFWGRLVEGYARTGNTAHALRILGSVRDLNLRVGYMALHELLYALVQNDEWENARELVRNVSNDTGGPISEHEHSKPGQRAFWKLARHYQLSDDYQNV